MGGRRQNLSERFGPRRHCCRSGAAERGHCIRVFADATVIEANEERYVPRDESLGDRLAVY
jgi:hypothetical protein